MAPRGIIMGNIFMCSWGNGVSQKAIISVAITHCRICSVDYYPGFFKHFYDSGCTLVTTGSLSFEAKKLEFSPKFFFSKTLQFSRLGVVFIKQLRFVLNLFKLLQMKHF